MLSSVIRSPFGPTNNVFSSAQHTIRTHAFIMHAYIRSSCTGHSSSVHHSSFHAPFTPTCIRPSTPVIHYFTQPRVRGRFCEMAPSGAAGTEFGAMLEPLVPSFRRGAPGLRRSSGPFGKPPSAVLPKQVANEAVQVPLSPPLTLHRACSPETQLGCTADLLVGGATCQAARGTQQVAVSRLQNPRKGPATQAKPS